MPNLKQVYAIKEQYSHLNETDKKVKKYLDNKNIDNDILKAIIYNDLDDRKTRLFSLLKEDFSPDKPDLIKYFEESRECDVALLFIDITSFSKTIQGWSNIKIKEYLDEYYSNIMPVIINNGGVIEKLMGDGIICLFGPPFLVLNDPEYVYKAEECAEEVLKFFHGSDKNVKVAIHKGQISYYKVPGDIYSEYTMIGQPITDLYRLESVSKPNAINFFAGSLYDKLGWSKSVFDKDKVNCWGFDVNNQLQGVDFTRVGYLKFPEYE